LKLHKIINIYNEYPIVSFLENRKRFKYRKIRLYYKLTNKQSHINFVQEITGKYNLKSVIALTPKDFKNRFPKYMGNYILQVEGLDIFSYGESVYNDIIRREKCIILMLDHIKDPQNLGAIIRSAVAFSISIVIIPKKRIADINEVCIKASVGGIFMIPIISISNLRYEIETLKKEGFTVYVATLSHPREKIDYIKPHPKSIIIVGEEHKGVSKIIEESADYRFYIPINEKINSLNVSVSTGIILYHFSKSLGGFNVS